MVAPRSVRLHFRLGHSFDLIRTLVCLGGEHDVAVTRVVYLRIIPCYDIVSIGVGSMLLTEKLSINPKNLQSLG